MSSALGECGSSGPSRRALAGEATRTDVAKASASDRLAIRRAVREAKARAFYACGRRPCPRAYTRRPLRRRSIHPVARLAVRAGAGAALAGAIAVPLMRRRLKVPAPLTLAAVAAGPLSLAVLRPRTARR